MAVCFPVWPSGQVASGARCPSALRGLLCFLPVVCVSISTTLVCPPPTPPPPVEQKRGRRVPGRWSWPAWQPWPSRPFPGRVEAELCLRVQESPGHLLSPVAGQTWEAGPEAGPSCPHAWQSPPSGIEGVPPLGGTEQEPGSLTQLPAASRACEDSPQLPVRVHLLSARSWRGRRQVGSGLCWAVGMGYHEANGNRHYDEPSARVWSHVGVPPGSCYVFFIYSGYFPIGRPQRVCLGSGFVLRCVYF